jgi:hypothetical protein
MSSRDNPPLKRACNHRSQADYIRVDGLKQDICRRYIVSSLITELPKNSNKRTCHQTDICYEMRDYVVERLECFLVYILPSSTIRKITQPYVSVHNSVCFISERPIIIADTGLALHDYAK